jgi:AcrR family transcriptional regulator
MLRFVPLNDNPPRGEHLAAVEPGSRLSVPRAEIGRIAADARVTTGAVYHHFSGKQGLCQATAERIEAEILVQASVVDETNPWLRLRLGFEKLVDFCAAADVQRIIFVEAPQVVGPEAWREVELRYAYGVLKKTLPALIDAGIVKPYPVDLIARTLLALLREASAEVARTKGDSKVRAQISDLVAGFFSTLERS